MNWRQLGKLALLGIGTFARIWLGVVVLALLAGVIYGVYRLGVAFFSLETEIARAIIAATGIASATILANIVGNVLAARARRAQDIRDRKREVYETLLRVLFDTLKIIDVKGQAEQAKMQAKIVSKMRDMTPKFLVWSSRPVINAWRRWQQEARAWEGGASQEQAVDFLLGLSTLVNQVRTELGLARLQAEESLGVFITDIDKHLPQTPRSSH